MDDSDELGGTPQSPSQSGTDSESENESSSSTQARVPVIPPVSPNLPLLQPQQVPNATQVVSKPLPQAIVEDYFQRLARDPKNKFYLKYDKEFNGMLHYDIIEGDINNRVKYSLQVNRDGQVSGNVSKFNKAALEMMIETLYQEMKHNSKLPAPPDKPQLVLSGSPEAIKVMEDKCKALGIEALDSKHKVLNPAPPQTTTTLSTAPPTPEDPVRISPAPRGRR